eukprot:g32212.t1
MKEHKKAWSRHWLPPQNLRSMMDVAGHIVLASLHWPEEEPWVPSAREESLIEKFFGQIKAFQRGNNTMKDGVYGAHMVHARQHAKCEMWENFDARKEKPVTQAELVALAKKALDHAVTFHSWISHGLTSEQIRQDVETWWEGFGRDFIKKRAGKGDEECEDSPEDGQEHCGEMDLSMWQRLNRGIETNGTNVPDHVQQQVYTLVNKAFIPELAVASARKSEGREGGPDEGGGPGEVAAERPTAPLLAPFAAAEGWAQIVGGGFPKPSGAAGVQTVTYSHVSSIFSEVTHGNSGIVRSPLAAGTDLKKSEAPSRMAKRDDFAWLSVVYTLLFFAAHPQTGAPYAFIELRRVCIAHMDEGNQELTLVGALDPEEPDTADFTVHRRDANGISPVGIVLLLPDGRWQDLSMPKLDLRFPSAESLKMLGTLMNQVFKGFAAFG